MAADLVMAAHFLLAAFVTLGLVVIPLGYKFGWTWVRNRRLRISHASVMGFVTAETVVGLTCPLTILEHNLRGDSLTQSFVSHWVQRVLYWDLPHEVFIGLYFSCFTWVAIIMAMVSAYCEAQVKYKWALSHFPAISGATYYLNRSITC